MVKNVKSKPQWKMRSRQSISTAQLFLANEQQGSNLNPGDTLSNAFYITLHYNTRL